VSADIDLSDTDRDRLGDLIDVLIPGGSGLPAASAVGTHRDWIDRALEAAPALGPVVRIVIDRTGEPAEVIASIQAEEPELFMGFALVASGAYLMHPGVRTSLGYDGLAVAKNPPMEGEAEFYLEDGLLDPVLARGPIYRPIPT
jgi:hypothetical protein